MTEPLDLERPAEPPRRRRWPWLIGIGAPLLVVVAIALALFQPWQLFIDKTVDDAAPVGAAPVGAAPASSTTSTSTTEPTGPSIVDTAPSTSTTAAPSTSAAPTTIAPPPPPPPVSMFVSLDHGTSGSLVILQDTEGRQFARIEDLATDQGPDVFVYLSTNTVDGPEEAFDDDVVNLGGLQGNLGNQNYEIPAGTDLTRYRSLVIWCDRFDSAFGAAPL